MLTSEPSLISEPQMDVIADALAGPGYICLDYNLPAALLQGLLAEFVALQEDQFKVAGIGRQADFQRQDSVRSDKIRWLGGDTPAASEFLQFMESLRFGINQRLFLGLFDYEAHFAHYEVGAFYQKHLDAFRGGRQQGKANRVLSTVLYLNENWQMEEGGELVIYAQDGEQILERVQPQFGRMVIFLSEEFPHEVKPATRERRSIAGWFRVNEGQ
jgi:SM-20-related protein